MFDVIVTKIFLYSLVTFFLYIVYILIAKKEWEKTILDKLIMFIGTLSLFVSATSFTIMLIYSIVCYGK